jgi:hypothetical protein
MKPRPEIISPTEAVSAASSSAPAEQPERSAKTESAEQDQQGLPSRARAQLAAFFKRGAERLSAFDDALARTESSTLTFAEVSRSVSAAPSVSAARRAAAARVEVLRAQARAALEEVDRVPGRAIAAFATRTRPPLRAITQRLAELEKRLER